MIPTFDLLFFEQYINNDEKIQHVFHRHIFVMIEDLLIWIFFGLLIPFVLFYLNIFHVRFILDYSVVHAYLFLIYFILIYKIFDWYLDVWIATDVTLVEMRWKWFTPQLKYIPYEKIESIEVRTHSWLYSVIGISDVKINLAGDEFHILSSAEKPKEVVQFLQDVTKPPKPEEIPQDKEPFEVLVDTLSGVVKTHLDNGGNRFITKEYIDKLDATLALGKPIDLRSIDEKTAVSHWKKRHGAVILENKK